MGKSFHFRGQQSVCAPDGWGGTFFEPLPRPGRRGRTGRVNLHSLLNSASVMGKYALLIAFASALGMAYFSQQSNRAAQDASADQAERQETVIARQIARSAFDDGMSRVRRDFEDIADGSESGSYEKGDYRLTYDVDNAGTKDKEVHITAEGTYNETTYRIRGRAERRSDISSLFNGITASGYVFFSVKGGGCSGGPCVSGIDAAGGEARHGITLPSDLDPDHVCDEFRNSVEGRGEGCDVVSRSDTRDEWVEAEMEKLQAEIERAIEEGAEEVVVCDDCRIKDLDRESGILYVTGELEFKGSRTWKGIVFVNRFGSIRINGGGSERNVNGSLLMEGGTEYDEEEDFDMRGGNRVKYNSEEVLKYIDLLPSIETKSIQLTDRRAGIVRRTE